MPSWRAISLTNCATVLRLAAYLRAPCRSRLSPVIMSLRFAMVLVFRARLAPVLVILAGRSLHEMLAFTWTQAIHTREPSTESACTARMRRSGIAWRTGCVITTCTRPSPYECMCGACVCICVAVCVCVCVWKCMCDARVCVCVWRPRAFTPKGEH